MKNKIIFLSIIILAFVIIFPASVKAGSMSASNYDVEVGNNVTVTVYFSSACAATVEITDYPSNFTLNGDSIKVYYDQTGGDSPISSMSFSFTANSAGGGNFSASITGLMDADENDMGDESASVYISASLPIEEVEDNDEEVENDSEEETFTGEDNSVDEENTEVISTPKPTPKPKNDNEESSNEAEEKEEKVEATLEPVIPLALSTLKVNGYELSPAFSKDIKEYSLTIKDLDIFKLEVEATANRGDSSVIISGNENIKIGENIITVKVKSDDDKENVEYKIKVNKELKTFEDELQKAQDQVTTLKMTIDGKDKLIRTLVLAVVVLAFATVVMGIFMYRKNVRNKDKH